MSITSYMFTSPSLWCLLLWKNSTTAHYWASNRPLESLWLPDCTMLPNVKCSKWNYIVLHFRNVKLHSAMLCHVNELFLCFRDGELASEVLSCWSLVSLLKCCSHVEVLFPCWGAVPVFQCWRVGQCWLGGSCTSVRTAAVSCQVLCSPAPHWGPGPATRPPAYDMQDQGQVMLSLL